ncbi:MAG TPA: hypothetical protein VHQ47_10605 [Phycisphaerae bacterium]|nr:hypothetical protein [Phycisphaerae bacterium]
MADVDSNLVRAIAEQVMAALRGNGSAGGGLALPAEIHTPIGQCTGDYSKFPELKHLQSAPAPASAPPMATAAPTAGGSGGASVPPAPASPPVPPVTALKGVITVSQLRAVRGPIRLAKGAMLTPLAHDFIKDHALNVMSDEMAAVVKVNAGAASARGAALPTWWWIEGQCPSVAKVVEALRPRLLASSERGGAENLKGAVKELAKLVKNGKVRGGVLFVPSAARAGCYANRCPSLRAVVATTERAVSEGLELLGANVLVIEYSQFGFKGMMPLVKPFVEQERTLPAGVAKELNELATCY